ncbi:MAG TPA: alpha/beta fold hydrolase [Longimicrobiales bacterium]|nr:alpha/beta fold hydrolase [Longimicrobiales bacterium]
MAARAAGRLGLGALVAAVLLAVTPLPLTGQKAPAFVPVLLVPGWADTGEDVAVLQERLRAAGWPEDRVAAVTFEHPSGSNREHAREIALAVDSLLARTDATSVDVVAHSMGGLATRYYLREHEGKVRRAVFLATPHRGTWSAYLAFGEGRTEMLPGSDFLEDLNSSPPVPPGVEAFTVRTLLETHVLPGESATLPGVPGWTVCCDTHWSLKRDPAVFEVVRNFLRHGVTP